MVQEDISRILGWSTDGYNFILTRDKLLHMEENPTESGEKILDIVHKFARLLEVLHEE